MAIGVLVCVAACGSTSPVKAASGSPVVTTRSGPASSTTTAPPKSNKPVKKSQPLPKTNIQLGLDVYWANQGHPSMKEIQRYAQEMVAYAQQLNANAVAFVFPFYVEGPTASGVYGTASTPSPAEMAMAVKVAVAAGLSVSVRPLLDEANISKVDPKGWRGTIEPDSRSQWFASYQKFILPYAMVAQKYGASTFTIGTELTSLGGDPNWQPLIAAVRKVFHGPHKQVAYSANFTLFVADGDGDVSGVDRVGVDAYWPIYLGQQATIAQLTAGWEQVLQRIASHGISLRHLVLDEVGIPAISNTYQEPYAWGGGATPLNLQTQYYWFSAALNSVIKYHLAGVYFWRLDFGTNPAKANPYAIDHGTFAGRPGAAAIKKYFAKIRKSSH
jgi:hypothetical protein